MVSTKEARDWVKLEEAVGWTLGGAPQSPTMQDDGSGNSEQSLNTVPADLGDSEEPAHSIYHYVSDHSSRSSSFNGSLAEIILGLFRQDVSSDARSSGLDLEGKDPAVRDMLIRANAQNEGSWVNRRLKRRELWDELDEDGDSCVVRSIS